MSPFDNKLIAGGVFWTQEELDQALSGAILFPVDPLSNLQFLEVDLGMTKKEFYSLIYEGIDLPPHLLEHLSPSLYFDCGYQLSGIFVEIQCGYVRRRSAMFRDFAVPH